MHEAELFVMPPRRGEMRDGIEGLVVDPFNARALAAAIGGLLGDPTRAGGPGGTRVKDFAWEGVTQSPFSET